MVQLFEGAFGRRFIANLLKVTVEGRAGAVALGFESGQPRMVAQIAKNEKPNLRVLAEFLRTKHQITPEVRHWLAELCDPDGKADMTLVIKRRGRRGRSRNSMMEYLPAVEEFRQLNAPHAYESAVETVTKKYGISRSTLHKAEKLLGPALDEHDRINREG